MAGRGERCSRFLAGSRSTEAQVARGISGISDRSSKARTKETLFGDRIQFFARAGNQRKGLLGRRSATWAEIQSLFSFSSPSSWQGSCTSATLNLPFSVYCGSYSYFASVLASPESACCDSLPQLNRGEMV
jgi:hypothetical protein